MYIARVRRLFVLLAPGARLRRLVCCFVTFADQCSGVSLCHDYGMIRRSLYLDRSPGLSFVQKRSSFTPRHERPRDDPSSGGGRRPFPTNPTTTTSHLVRRLACSSKLLKSSSRYLPRFASMADALRLQITANDQVRRISPGIPFSK